MASRTKRKARKGSILPRSKAKRRLAWMAVATGTAYAAAAITNTALSQGYQAVRGKQPPEDELARGTSWPAVLGWSMASAAVVALAQVLVQRGAAAGWKAATGMQPPR